MKWNPHVSEQFFHSPGDTFVSTKGGILPVKRWDIPVSKRLYKTAKLDIYVKIVVLELIYPNGQ